MRCDSRKPRWWFPPSHGSVCTEGPEMTRVISLIVVLMSIGCAKTGQLEAAHPSTWWESSNSPCMDALQINLIAENCEEVENKVIQGIWLQLKCQKGGEGPWTEGWWLFTPTGLEPLPEHMPVCVDQAGMLAVRNQ